MYLTLRHCAMYGRGRGRGILRKKLVKLVKLMSNGTQNSVWASVGQSDDFKPGDIIGKQKTDEYAPKFDIIVEKVATRARTTSGTKYAFVNTTIQ